MYKALHQPSGSEIILLDPRWESQIEYLRGLDRQDQLVGPGCEQPVRVRAGKFKRAHFAHKHLQNCPFERLSARLLQTRAVLYDWLVSRFDPPAVRIEKHAGSPTGLRPFDCWVERESGSLAYWIFDRRMPPDERQDLQSFCAENTLDVQWVFVIDLLRPDQGWPQSRLHLTTTERAFIRGSELDQAWQTHFEQLGGSLHYLDPDQGTLTSYRNLSLVHPPQLYGGKRLHTPLADLGVSENTDEFCHPGEMARLVRTRRRISAQQRQAEERLQQVQDFLKGASFSQGPYPQTDSPAAPTPFERRGTCRVCGAITSDWVTYFGDTRECICRACKDRV